ncbi:MAG: type III-A CRISPR-associated RAMP protein Csm5, partial [bacterium]
LLEYKTIRLKTISPVHIKGKDIEYGQGFVRRDEFTAYAIDANKLAEYLFEFSNDFTLVEKYAQQIEKLSLQNKLKDFDNEKFLAEARIYHHKRNKAREHELIRKGVFSAVVNATPDTHFIRDGLGRPFIPGSSLKGVIRTAIMYDMAKKFLHQSTDNQVKSFLVNISDVITRFEEQTQGKNATQLDKAKASFSQRIQQLIFQKQPGIKPHFDFMRCLKVKDSASLQTVTRQTAMLISLKMLEEEQSTPAIETPELSGEIGTITAVKQGVAVLLQGKQYEFTNKVYRKHFELLKKNVGKQIRIIEAGGNKIREFEILSEIGEKEEGIVKQPSTAQTYPVDYKYKNNNQPVDFQIETFDGTAKMDVTLDLALLKEMKSKNKYIPFSTIEDIFQMVGQFGSELWAFEKTFWDNCFDEPLDVSRVREFYYQHMERNKLRIGWGTGLMGMTINMLLEKPQQIELRNRLFIDRKDAPAPKSRRLIVEDEEPILPLGWMEFEICE